MKIKKLVMAVAGVALAAGLTARVASAGVQTAAYFLDMRADMLKNVLPASCTYSLNESDSTLTVTFGDDLSGVGPYELPDDMGPLAFDVNGKTITGKAGAAGSYSADGGDGSPVFKVGSGTTITVTNTATGASGGIVGGKGGDGKTGGAGAEAFVDAQGSKFAVTDAAGLVKKGADGAALKSPTQEKLEEIFDAENTGTTVEPQYDEDGNLTGHKVILGADYGPVAISNDLGAITIDLNGWTIRGTNGVDGTNLTAGGNGGAAIVVAGASGIDAGATAITVINEPVPPPAGQLWAGGPIFAEYNVGASSPEEYGYYFWWGDTVGYTNNGLSGASAKWVSVKDGTTSIQFDSSDTTANQTYDKGIDTLKSEGWIGEDGNLVAAHDAATAHLGAPWRMMTKAEFDELCANCETEWTNNWNNTGVKGRIVKGKGAYSANSIFLPTAGDGSASSLVDSGSEGYYWLSAPNSNVREYAWQKYFTSSEFYTYSSNRYYGHPVRPVRDFAGGGDRPAPGPSAALIGGDGGDGNPAGKGAFAVVDAEGNPVAVTDLAGLIQKGDDGEFLKAPAQEKLEEIFDTENTGTTVEPQYDEDGNLTGHKVILGADYGPVAISNDLGAITIDLNGKTIKGEDGDDGTWDDDGADGGAAIVVDGESGASMGDTAITVKDESEPSGQIAGGDGGDGKTGGKGAPAIVDAEGNPYENVTAEDGLLEDGDDGRAYGDPELPWEIGPEGEEETLTAYTNGNGQVFVEGSGEPQPDVTPWDPETPDIVVPPGSGDTYREAWPEFADRIVEADYLRLAAAGGDVTVGMAGGAEALILEWTLDPTNGPWTVFEAGASNATIAAGATACFRRHELEPQAAANGWGFTFTGAGTVAAAGNALAVLDRTTLAKSVGESALAGLFSGCAKLTAAPALPAKTLGANCYREMFKGCTALAETPALPAPELAAGCYAGMFEGCSNLSKARVVFTNWVDGATADWLKDVRETGDFICVPQLALPASRGGSTIPPGWTPYGPQVRLVEVRPVLRQLGCFTVKYELSGLYPPDAYRLVQKYTVRGQDRSVTTELGHPANGVYTVTNDVRTLYGELVVDPAAHLKVSLFGKGEE